MWHLGRWQLLVFRNDWTKRFLPEDGYGYHGVCTTAEGRGSPLRIEVFHLRQSTQSTSHRSEFLSGIALSLAWAINSCRSDPPISTIFNFEQCQTMCFQKCLGAKGPWAWITGNEMLVVEKPAPALVAMNESETLQQIVRDSSGSTTRRSQSQCFCGYADICTGGPVGRSWGANTELQRL